MPKLLQDGVVIMPGASKLYQYNASYYTGNSKSPGLVVKHLDSSYPYVGTGTRNINYTTEYTLSGNSESNKFRSLSRDSKKRNQHHSNKYHHRDEYIHVQNRSMRADCSYFDLDYNPRYLMVC